MNKAKGYMNLTLLVFRKKNPQMGQMSHFGLKMACCHISGSTLSTSGKFCVIKKAKKVNESCINSFSKKYIILGKWAILGLKMG